MFGVDISCPHDIASISSFSQLTAVRKCLGNVSSFLHACNAISPFCHDYNHHFSAPLITCNLHRTYIQFTAGD